MKKLMTAALLTVIYQAYAIFGIGLHIGVDGTSVDAEKVNAFNVNIADVDYSYDLEREAFSNPFAFGTQLYLDIPVVPLGFELGFEGAWTDYSWQGDNKLEADGLDDIELRFPGYDFPDNMYEETFSFSRVGVDLTGKWYVFSLPPVVKTFKFYVGGGAGFYWITPIVSKQMIMDELQNRNIKIDETTGDQYLNFDVEEYAEELTVFGTHFVAGMQMKMPMMPVSFNVDYKYVMTEENEYGDETNDFGVVKGSLNLYL